MTDDLAPVYDLSTHRGMLDSIRAKRALLPVVDHNGFPVSPKESAPTTDPATQPEAPAEPPPPADFGGGHRGADIPVPVGIHAQIAAAEQAGNHMAAIALKRQLFQQLPLPPAA